MGMTFEEAKHCLLSPSCKGCKYDRTKDNCMETAHEIGALCIDYLILKQKQGEVRNDSKINNQLNYGKAVFKYADTDSIHYDRKREEKR